MKEGGFAELDFVKGIEMARAGLILPAMPAAVANNASLENMAGREDAEDAMSGEGGMREGRERRKGGYL